MSVHVCVCVGVWVMRRVITVVESESTLDARSLRCRCFDFPGDLTFMPLSEVSEVSAAAAGLTVGSAAEVVAGVGSVVGSGSVVGFGFVFIMGEVLFIELKAGASWTWLSSEGVTFTLIMEEKTLPFEF